MKQSNKIYLTLFYIIIISLSISPAVVTSEEDSRNYLLIGLMGLGPIFYLCSLNTILNIDKKIYTFLLLLFTITILFNFRTIKWTSMMFTCMFGIYFLAGVHCALRAKVTAVQICKITRLIIYAYFIVLVIQQLCVLFGFPIFNANLLSETEKWKLNSLAAEPSHTSRYVGILMFSFLYAYNKSENKRLSFIDSVKSNKFIWFAFCWIILTSISGTGILVFILVLSIFINKRNGILFLLGIGFVFIVGVTSEMTALKRSTTFINAVFTGSNEAMIEADHSASVRIVPWLLCINRINPTSFRSWVGEGSGSTSQWMSTFMPGVPKDWSGGGIANVMVEYGIIIGLYYLILSFRLCHIKEYKICSIGLWIMSVILVGINMQMAWLCMLMLFLINHLKYNENKSILQLT